MYGPGRPGLTGAFGGTMKKIKKGRYPGQPDWVPDCDMYFNNQDETVYYIIRYITKYGSLIVRSDGKLKVSCNNTSLINLNYTPIYETKKAYRIKSATECMRWIEENGGKYLGIGDWKVGDFLFGRYMWEYCGKKFDEITHNGDETIQAFDYDWPKELIEEIEVKE